MSATGKRTRRPEQRRGEILEAALQQFSAHGYHATGVADIAASLKMSHGTFYRYFDSKQDILEQLVDMAAARIATAIADAGPPESATTLEEYRDQVTGMASALDAAISDDPRIARLMLLEAMAVDPLLTERIFGHLERLRGITASYLRHGVSAGYLRPGLDPVQTARAINGMIYAGALDVAAGGREHQPYVEAAVRLMFHGIAA